MKKPTTESATQIELGDVIRLSWKDANDKEVTCVGVVYGNDSFGLRMNCEDYSRYACGRLMVDGQLMFEILEDHEPVAKYGMEYDFVSHHKKQ